MRGVDKEKRGPEESQPKQQAQRVRHLQEENQRLRMKIGEWENMEEMFWRRIGGLEREVG